MPGKSLRSLALVSAAALVAAFALGLRVRPARRRPGADPEDLLPARAACDRRAVRLHGGRNHGGALPTHGRLRLGHAFLRRNPPVDRVRRGGARHGLDPGQGELGPLVGVGRADARVVPHRLPSLLHLPATPLHDQGHRPPSPVRLGVHHHGGRVRTAQLHRGYAWPRPTPTRGSSPRQADRCRARCDSRSWSH